VLRYFQLPLSLCIVVPVTLMIWVYVFAVDL
jgi:hypothetical protein